MPPNSKNTNAFIILFAKLFNNDWEQDKKISAFLTSINDDISNTSLDILYILTASLQKTNIRNSSDFVFLTQLDIEKP